MGVGKSKVTSLVVAVSWVLVEYLLGPDVRAEQKTYPLSVHFESLFLLTPLVQFGEVMHHLPIPLLVVAVLRVVVVLVPPDELQDFLRDILFFHAFPCLLSLGRKYLAVKNGIRKCREFFLVLCLYLVLFLFQVFLLCHFFSNHPSHVLQIYRVSILVRLLGVFP